MSREILVVDDDQVILNLAEIMLKKLGYTVYTARSGREAMVKTVEMNPDLVLMDINLGDAFTGIDAAKYIYHAFSTPVVFLTGNFDEKTVESSKKAEPFGFIAKPFDSKDLMSALEIAFNSYEITSKLKGIKKKKSYKSLMLMDNGVILISTGGNIIFMNPYAEQITGWKYGEAFLKPINRVIAIKDRYSQERVAVGNTLTEQIVWNFVTEGNFSTLDKEFTFLSKEGKKRHIKMKVYSFKDSSNDFVGHFIYLEQIFGKEHYFKNK